MLRGTSALTDCAGRHARMHVATHINHSALCNTRCARRCSQPDGPAPPVHPGRRALSTSAHAGPLPPLQPPPPATVLYSPLRAQRSSPGSLPFACAAASRPASSASGPSRPDGPSWALLRISGDGACMFRALVQGAQIATRGKPMPPESEGSAAHNLRLAVVAELRKRREEIEPFLPGIASDFEEYCRTMSHPMAWGGEPEMLMASHVLQRPITVYHMQGAAPEPIVTYGDHMLPRTPAIHLLWSGAHYDLLVEPSQLQGQPVANASPAA